MFKQKIKKISRRGGSEWYNLRMSIKRQLDCPECHTGDSVKEFRGLGGPVRHCHRCNVTYRRPNAKGEVEIITFNGSGAKFLLWTFDRHARALKEKLCSTGEISS